MSARIEDKGDRIVIWNGNAHKRGALSPELYACIGQAIEMAAEPRIRAVILTSLTTIAGLSPMMFESSSLAFYMSPIAVTLCFGLAFATLLVLIVIPALITLLEASHGHLAEGVRRLIDLIRNPAAELTAAGSVQHTSTAEREI